METLEEARQLDRRGRRLEVLVLVKTTPTPSSKYEDTVCVAGIALSPGPLRLVRLYPIQFRHLTVKHQFAKYQRIHVDVSQPRDDLRPESLKVNVASIELGEIVKKWGSRHEVLANLPMVSACELIQGVKQDLNGPSLGVIRPQKETIRLLMSKHPGWSARQLEVLEKWAQSQIQSLPLEGVPLRDAPDLECPPLRVRYKYQCGLAGCPGHEQGILDWELTALQRRAQNSGANVREWVANKYGGEMLADDRETFFILGNNKDPRKRASFGVLSVLYPKSEDVSLAPALFNL